MDGSMSEQEAVRLFQPIDDTEEDDAAGEDDRISWEYDLIEDVASALEEFVRLNHVKRFDEAERLYQACLENHEDWFPVVAEFAEHLLLRRSYKKLVEFSEKSTRVATDSREMQVLIMMRVIANIYLNESFQDAIAYISIIWYHFPIDYSRKMPIDTEIHLLELLLQAAVLTKRYRGPLLIKLDSLPQFLCETKWKYFIAWFDHLFDHGYYWEAHRIFRWLLEVLPLSKTKSLLQSRLEAVRQMKNRGEALQTAISASLQVFMQHLEGVGCPEDSEWNDFVTQAIFGYFSGHEKDNSLVESDNAVWEQLQDTLQCQLPLTHNQRNDTKSHNLLPIKTLNLEQCWKDLTKASDLSRYDMHAVFRSAVKEGHVLFVRQLSKQKEVLECKDLFQQRPLHLAAANGHNEIVEIIVDAGATIDCEDWFRRTALGLAAENGHCLVVQSLYGKFKGEDSKQEELWSMALHCAVKNGRKAVVLALLAVRRGKPKIRLDTLILAIQRRHRQIVRLLLKFEPDLITNAQDTWGWTPLMYAIHENDDAIRDLLIANGALPDIHKPSHEDANSESPLLYVSKQGLDALANMLLRQDAFETTSEGDHQTAIVYEKRAHALSKYKPIEVNTKDRDGRTVLSYAAGSEFVETVKLLLERQDIEVNTQDIEGRTALSYAAENGKWQTVEALLGAENIDVSRGDKEGQNPLSLAMTKRNWRVVEKFAERDGIRVILPYQDYSTQLLFAAESGCCRLVRLLMENKEVDVNVKNDSLGGTPLLLSVKNGHKDIVQLLLEREDINADLEDCFGRTPLSYAAELGNEALVRILLNREDINAYSTDRWSSTPLMYALAASLELASANGHVEIVRLLLHKGSDVMRQGRVYENALMAASDNGHQEAVQLLLESGADANWGNPLRAASISGHEKIAKLLLKHGADVNPRDRNTESALYLASRHGRENLVTLLLEYGASVNAPGGIFGTALQVASTYRHTETVRLLLNGGADVNLQGGDFQNALQAASLNGHEEIVKMLLKCGGDINTGGGTYGVSALYIASREGHEGVVRLLLLHKADVNAPGGRYGSALQAASRFKRQGVVNLLKAAQKSQKSQ